MHVKKKSQCYDNTGELARYKQILFNTFSQELNTLLYQIQYSQLYTFINHEQSHED